MDARFTSYTISTNTVFGYKIMKLTKRGGARYDADGNLKTGKKAKPEAERKVTKTFSLDPELNEWINGYIKENKLNFSAWVVGLIERERETQHLKNIDNNNN